MSNENHYGPDSFGGSDYPTPEEFAREMSGRLVRKAARDADHVRQAFERGAKHEPTDAELKAELDEFDKTHGVQKRELGVNPKDAIGLRKWRLSCVSAPVLAEMSLGMLEGACKYRRHNYRVAPVRASVYYDALIHHVMAWWEGQDIDPDSGIHHLGKALSCLAVIRDAQMQGTWVDDRPPPATEGWQERMNEMVRMILDRYPEQAPYLAADAPSK